MNELILNKTKKYCPTIKAKIKFPNPFLSSKAFVALLAVLLCAMQVNAQFTTIKQIDGATEGRHTPDINSAVGDYANPQMLLYNSFLYGVFSNGGSNDQGTIFKVKTDGTDFTVMLTFDGSTTGGHPRGGLVLGSDSYLYGTTFEGGAAGGGTIFKIAPDGTGFSTIMNFSEATGYNPRGTLAADGDGILYGTTTNGEFHFPWDETPNNWGVFKIAIDGSGFANIKALDNSSLHSDDFSGYTANGVILGHDGYLYGTNLYGGYNNNGTIFKLNTDGSDFTVLDNMTAGAYPEGQLVEDSDGYLYGTTPAGASNGGGVVFKIKADGTDFTTLAELGSFNLSQSESTLVFGTDGYLYGIARNGGENGFGAVYKVSKTGSFEIVKSFESGEGNGIGSLVADNSGILFGSTHNVLSNSGTIFSSSPVSINTAPEITSNNGTDITSIDMFENVKHVTTVTANDAESNTLTYSIQPSADDHFFTINSSTGELSFIDAPDYENPQGSNGTSQYNIVVRVTDNGSPALHDDQVMYINVNNADELIYTSVSDNTPCPGTTFNVFGSLTGEFEGQSHDFQAQLSDANGSFDSPLVIGSTTTSLSGSNPGVFIQAMLPFTVTNGSGYKIRVVSSTLAYGSVETEDNIQILKARLGADKTVSKCIGSSIDLTGIFRNNGDTYEWNTENPQTVTQSGRYTVLATSANGCQVRANVDVTDVTKPDLGKDTVIKISSGTVNLTTFYNTAGLTAKWNTGTPTAAGAGRYRLIVSNDGCKDTASAKVVITHNMARGAADQSLFSELTKVNEGLHAAVYPNPVRTTSNLQVSGFDRGYSVILSDLLGRAIWKTENVHFAIIALPVDRLPAGTYTVTVISGSEIRTLKLMKQ